MKIYFWFEPCMSPAFVVKTDSPTSFNEESMKPGQLAEKRGKTDQSHCTIIRQATTESNKPRKSSQKQSAKVSALQA